MTGMYMYMYMYTQDMCALHNNLMYTYRDGFIHFTQQYYITKYGPKYTSQNRSITTEFTGKIYSTSISQEVAQLPFSFIKNETHDR